MMNSKIIKTKKRNRIKSNLLSRFDKFVYEMIEDRELLKFTRELKPGAKYAIFGGMLRDFSLYGHKEFTSDIDVVVQQKENTNLINVLKKYNTKINSLGGLRVKVGKWVLDIWHLENTWAFKEGLIKEYSFKSLVNTTFFNWDAIVLELDNKERRLYCKKNYFNDLERRYLTINLEMNPNPRGVAYRALKHFIMNDANISYSLAQYINNQVEIYGKENIINNIILKQGKLSLNLVNMALEQIKKYLEEKQTGSIKFINPQLELKFNEDNYLNVKMENVEKIENSLSKVVQIKYVKEQLQLLDRHL